MITRRVIVLLTLKDGVLFRTKWFRPDYRYTQSFLATLAVDEVVIVDVGEDRTAFLQAARNYADRCFSPITIGGRVRDLAEIRTLFREIGADKILLKAGHRLTAKVAESFGSQAVVSGVDYSGNENPLPIARGAVGQGAGEILLTSIDRDGSLQGYDLDNLKRVCADVSVPVVASGGCGGWSHMKEAFEAGASGAATSVIHHFPETSLMAFKRNLSGQGIPIRC